MVYTFEEQTIPLDSKNTDPAFRELFEEGVRQGFFTTGQKTISIFTARMKNPDPTECGTWDLVIKGGVSHDGRKFLASYAVAYVCGSDSNQYYDDALLGTWLREYTGGAVDGSYAASVSNTNTQVALPVGVNPLAKI